MITRSVFDNIVILVYMISVLAVGVYYSRYNRNSTEYFLGGRKFGWITIGLSLFIANIVIEQFIGMIGLKIGNGLLVGYLELLSAVLILISIWVLMPVIFRVNVFTIAELLERRFNRASGIYISYVTLTVFVITNLSISLYVGSFLLNKTMGWDMVTSGVVLIIVTGIYSITGGMRAVMYTGVLQAAILISGLLLLLFFGLSEAGDLNIILTGPENVFSIFQPVNDPELPWTGVLFALPVLGIWYWYIDQYAAQRIIAAENINQARKGGFFAAGLKIISIFLIVSPALIAVSLFPEISPDQAFVALTTSHILPIGIRGLVISGILAAVMSSLGH
ncbi:MAG: sodium/solute symporter, partial [Calditrichaceae bacterium]